jgi:deoxyribodipyrimidine photolyase
MTDKGLFWIREDFRIENNPALSFATQNHENVIAYLFIIIKILIIKLKLKNGGFQNH